MSGMRNDGKRLANLTLGPTTAELLAWHCLWREQEFLRPELADLLEELLTAMRTVNRLGFNPFILIDLDDVVERNIRRLREHWFNSPMDSSLIRHFPRGGNSGAGTVPPFNTFFNSPFHRPFHNPVNNNPSNTSFNNPFNTPFIPPLDPPFDPPVNRPVNPGWPTNPSDYVPIRLPPNHPEIREQPRFAGMHPKNQMTELQHYREQRRERAAENEQQASDTNRPRLNARLINFTVPDELSLDSPSENEVEAASLSGPNIEIEDVDDRRRHPAQTNQALLPTTATNNAVVQELQLSLQPPATSTQVQTTDTPAPPIPPPQLHQLSDTSPPIDRDGGHMAPSCECGTAFLCPVHAWMRDTGSGGSPPNNQDLDFSGEAPSHGSHNDNSGLNEAENTGVEQGSTTKGRDKGKGPAQTESLYPMKKKASEEEKKKGKRRKGKKGRDPNERETSGQDTAGSSSALALGNGFQQPSSNMPVPSNGGQAVSNAANITAATPGPSGTTSQQPSQMPTSSSGIPATAQRGNGGQNTAQGMQQNTPARGSASTGNRNQPSHANTSTADQASASQGTAHHGSNGANEQTGGETADNQAAENNQELGEKKSGSGSWCNML